MDITTDQEEPDPLNQMVSQGRTKPGSSPKVEDRLKEIDQLLARGVISQSEHAAQRERILREI